MVKLAIFDIDGTVSNGAWRKLLRPKNDVDFEENEKKLLMFDDILPVVFNQLVYRISKGWRTAFVTGRPEGMKKATKKWLIEQGLKIKPDIYFRPNDWEVAYIPEYKRGTAYMICKNIKPDVLEIYEDKKSWLESMALGAKAAGVKKIKKFLVKKEVFKRID